MGFKVFIDGEAGTTGLQIRERLLPIKEIELLSIDEAKRKDQREKRAIFSEADVVILCLHDDAAKESVALVDALQAERGKSPRVIDASTAHRVDPSWVYGFAEMQTGQSEKIRQAKYVSNPGCYATGAISLLAPLTKMKPSLNNFPFHITAISGYSGGGRSMMEAYESGSGSALELYALSLNHKHLPEIMRYGNLTHRPSFTPIVGNFAQGMIVQIALPMSLCAEDFTAQTIRDIYTAHYGHQQIVKLCDTPSNGKLDAASMMGHDDLEIYVCETPAIAKEAPNIVLIARLDNLGKGASGAAVQNLKIMLDIK